MQIHPFFEIAPSIIQNAEAAAARLAPVFARIDETTDYNQQKMLAMPVSVKAILPPAPAMATGTGDGRRLTASMLMPWARRMRWCAITSSAAPMP